MRRGIRVSNRSQGGERKRGEQEGEDDMRGALNRRRVCEETRWRRRRRETGVVIGSRRERMSEGKQAGRVRRRLREGNLKEGREDAGERKGGPQTEVR